MKTNRDPNHDFFRNLPRDMMIDILLRLPNRSIMRCKCVCKSWRDLIKSREFVEFHFSRSRLVPCLALFQESFSKPFKIIELVDTQNSGENCNAGLNFSFPHQIMIHSSANGLLFLSNDDARDLFICNPITREYINVPREYTKIPPSFGFGVSKLSHEYKVVAIFYKAHFHTYYPAVFTPCKCEVYTLKTGSWRSVATDGLPSYAEQMRFVASLNGNLHWLVGTHREDQFRKILCFDLETECFTTFSIPYLEYGSMCVLGDCLCLCDNSRDGLVIWMMKKYGDDKSWTKEFVIEIRGLYDFRTVVPIKVFKHGDILFVRHRLSSKLYCYSSKTKTIRETDNPRSSYIVYTGPCIYTPSFFPLKTLTVENNVISF